MSATAPTEHIARDAKPAKRGRHHIVTRSFSLFTGLFGLLNTAGVLLGHTANQNIWWIDYSFLTNLIGTHGAYIAVALQVLTSVALMAWGLAPNARTWRRVATAALTGTTAVVALQNAITYWGLLASHQLYAGVPVPLSLAIAVVLILLTAIVFRTKNAVRAGRGVAIRLIIGVCVLTFVFPLLQIGFFGTTDYRRAADAAIVPGAQVHEDGSLSMALSERMDTAVQLYDEGYVHKLIVSGGTGVEGVNEAETMRDYAVAAGVPSDAVIVDTVGVTTEATVDNSIAIMQQQDMNQVIVTSSFYHMPRIKMMYLARGVDVFTVPTVGDIKNNGTATAIWREVPGWWVYWLKNTLIG